MVTQGKIPVFVPWAPFEAAPGRCEWCGKTGGKLIRGTGPQSGTLTHEGFEFEGGCEF